MDMKSNKNPRLKMDWSKQDLEWIVKQIGNFYPFHPIVKPGCKSQLNSGTKLCIQYSEYISAD